MLREAITGRYYIIVNVECDGEEPAGMFPDKVDADLYLARRQGLPEEDPEHLTEFHQVFPCDIAGAWWNSYEPDPRADNPLTPEEIVKVCNG